MCDCKVSQKPSKLRKGDLVMVISGGNRKSRPIKGKTGKIVRLSNNRAVVEGLNYNVRHQRARGPQQPAGKLRREGSIHVSNLMYFADKIKKPVKLTSKVLADGTRVRGYVNPESKQFEQV